MIRIFQTDSLPSRRVAVPARNFLLDGVHEAAGDPFAFCTGGTGPAGGASVSGGFANLASGDNASVSGGMANTASGIDSSILGGIGNTVSTSYGTYPM
jgi:trimeric autotransporter adhesin